MLRKKRNTLPPVLYTTVLLMRLHLGRLFISILFGHFHVFSRIWGLWVFYANPLGRVPGVNIYIGFQSVSLFLRNVSRPLSALPRAHQLPPGGSFALETFG